MPELAVAALTAATLKNIFIRIQPILTIYTDYGASLVRRKSSPCL